MSVSQFKGKCCCCQVRPAGPVAAARVRHEGSAADGLGALHPHQQVPGGDAWLCTTLPTAAGRPWQDEGSLRWEKGM